ncbi:MAG: hypothetical protein Kow0037_25630 [Calditrichia bacterium]
MNPNNLKHSHPVPLLILGGSANALSIVRSLGKQKIPVYFSGLSGSHAQYSRYCAGAFPYHSGETVKTFWRNLLLSPDNQFPEGTVIFACEDAALEFVIEYFPELEKRYRLGDSTPELLATFLNKQKTLELARKIDFPHPGFWNYSLNGNLDLETDHLAFPVIIKPILSHRFQNAFNGRKYFIAENREQLLRSLKLLKDKQLEALITEIIPGPDHLLASYNAYIKKDGQPLYEYTKSIVRRYPVNEGLASCHKLEWLPEIADIGKKFVKKSCIKGFFNIELKYDSRDNQYKIIEVNPRFTAHQPLIVKAGLNTAELVYRYLLGEKVAGVKLEYHPIRLWYPSRDVRAFWQLNREKAISLSEYLSSLKGTVCFPFYERGDTIALLKSGFKKVKRKLLKS